MLISIALQEFALPGNIFLLSLKRVSEFHEATTHFSKRRSPDPNPTRKFVNLLHQEKWSNPATAHDRASDLSSTPNSWMRLRSPNFTLRPNHFHRPESLTPNIGIQNDTIPTVTADLIIQQLGLLEHFLPRDGRYSSIHCQIQWCNFPTGAPIVDELARGQLNIGILGDYPLLLSALQSQEQGACVTRRFPLILDNRQMAMLTSLLSMTMSSCKSWLPERVGVWVARHHP
ncbi:hypothetical protein [Leptothermofonsia sp. ETS-13]|uniref:hypothetical protein n=1 Tax=Leptothermofonsia sp. ETS-13 TaxID=3035696 RepID=UPI003B9E0C49